MPDPVVHWEIGAEDADKLGAFYRDLFGWETTPAGPEYWLVAGSDGGIGGGILQVAERVPPYLTFYVRVEGLEASLRRAVGLGARERVAPTTVPGVGRFAMLEDPEGHLVGLLEPDPDAPDAAQP